MTNHGDDCYFFYYSTCTKGESCPFRHCEAAMGNETVCSLWQEGRCFRTVCKFRHMEITKNRKEIPCYWENQSAGCQKPHCAFFHEKPRYIDGTFVPPDKSVNKNKEQPHEEPAPPAVAPLPTAANPQLRGIMKTEAQEPVPSPTHPPVVINPVDDDEDEDDQFSEEGEDSKVGLSPRKLPKSDNSLNFGVSTLEEIRLRRALKASMKRAGYPIQSADTSANGEKENIQSFYRPVLYEQRDGLPVFEEPARSRGSVTERLGRKIPSADVSEESPALKRSLAERLGRVMDEGETLMPPQKALKPIKERLGLSTGSVDSQQADAQTKPKMASEQIRIKTLEEIRQEKATKSQSKDGLSAVAAESNNIKATKGVRRAITVKDHSISHVKTFSEILQAKKKRQEEEQWEQNPLVKKTKLSAEKAPGKSQGEDEPSQSVPEAKNDGMVRVKTLQEIRREKAARIQAQQAAEAKHKRSSEAEENGSPRPRLLRIKKLASQTVNLREKTPDVAEKQVKSFPAAAESSVADDGNVKVKTFEEIMREKRLRKQEMEEQAKSSAEAELCQKQTTEESQKGKVPVKVRVTLPGSSSPSSTSVTPDTTPSSQRVSIRHLIPLRSKSAMHLNSISPAVTSTSVLQSMSELHPQSIKNSRAVPDKDMRNSATSPPAKQARAAAQGPNAETHPAEKTLSNKQKKSPEQTTETKVRPKLNVKPSVMKPAAQVKPGQKRRVAECSAVAAVKPLNSASTVLDEPPQKTACRETQVFSSSGAEAALLHSPSVPLDSGSSSSPLTEELQTVPVFKHSLSQETKSRESCTVPQSPILKTPAQPRSRRSSLAAASCTASTSGAAVLTSPVDDFEELISEFTEENLESEDVDPAIGEDDLLQELSEMIDS